MTIVENKQLQVSKSASESVLFAYAIRAKNKEQYSAENKETEAHFQVSKQHHYHYFRISFSLRLTEHVSPPLEES